MIFSHVLFLFSDMGFDSFSIIQFKIYLENLSIKTVGKASTCGHAYENIFTELTLIITHYSNFHNKCSFYYFLDQNVTYFRQRQIHIHIKLLKILYNLTSSLTE